MTKLEILQACIERLDSYGAPTDDSPIFIRQDNTLFELTLEDGSFNKQFSLGDLRDVLREVGVK